jgi:LacI family transcriptional regulator
MSFAAELLFSDVLRNLKFRLVVVLPAATYHSKMRKTPVTIKDIARRCGVHASTVSRVLNPATRAMVSRKLTAKVMEAAKEMGYRRNPLASGLRTRRSHTIGVMIPDLTNPLFPPIVRGIERTLGGHGYIAILADSANNPETELAILANMRARQVEGLIIATAHRRDPVVEECIEHGIPVVLVNRTVDDDKVASVINNDDHGIRLAVQHLVDLGHRRIAHIAGPQDTSTGYTRRQAFVEAIEAAGLEGSRELIAEADSYTEPAGRAAADELMQAGKLFTAIVAGNDLLALGCYDALKERGLKCPDDISVTGFNDVPFIDRLSPPLTTVQVPQDQLGVRATELLMDHIQARQSDTTVSTPPLQVRLDPTLVVRGSTRAVSTSRAGATPRRSTRPARVTS